MLYQLSYTPAWAGCALPAVHAIGNRQVTLRLGHGIVRVAPKAADPPDSKRV